MKLRSALVLLPMLACGDSAATVEVNGLYARCAVEAISAGSSRALAARPPHAAAISHRGLTGYIRSAAGPVRSADLMLAAEMLREAGALKIAIQSALLTDAARADCHAAGLMLSRTCHLHGQAFDEFYVNLYRPDTLVMHPFPHDRVPA